MGKGATAVQKQLCGSLKVKELPYDPAVPLMGTYPEEMTAEIQIHPYILTRIAVISTVVRGENNQNAHQQMKG